ncbi:MAG: phenylalanine--tRNA ligase subunit alpha [Nanoarchaeota archaeon]|nr:phenylalanine--tRNA ligase subunit alpha [Nanoarchaeota archaeon]
MNINTIIKKLHPLEIKTLSHLKKEILFSELQKNTGLKEVEITRAIQWLGNKNIITIDEEIKELIELDKNGVKYKKEGLPEKRFLKATRSKNKISEIKKEAKLEDEEINICIGSLKKKAAIAITKEQELIITLTEQGKKLLEKEFLEEQFLKKDFPIELDSLKPEEIFAFENLIKRKEIIKKNVKKIRTIKLTILGEEVKKKGVSTKEVIERLTPKILKDKSWKNKEFRAYDVSINVPKITRGKRHFVNQAIDYARRIWLDMGFEEMTGNLLQTSFWNFDALFTAQDHPVRDLQDTFFIKKPATGKLPKKEFIDKIKNTHENGWTTNSKGWQYEWDEETSKKNVLRTHTTCLSAQTLAKLSKKDIPKKFFALGKCFRNETLDWSHLFEFNQTEGIVIDKNANFRHLLGYLKAFFKKMGYEKARFRPAYFPYTEFSVEIDVLHPIHKTWFELGGAGIFRPEVVKPLLGIDIPVLAWGPGFDRIILEFFKINDIRELYKNDLKQLREIKDWIK